MNMDVMSSVTVQVCLTECLSVHMHEFFVVITLKLDMITHIIAKNFQGVKLHGWTFNKRFMI